MLFINLKVESVGWHESQVITNEAEEVREHKSDPTNLRILYVWSQV